MRPRETAQHRTRPPETIYMRAVQGRGDGRTGGPCVQSSATVIGGQTLVILELVDLSRDLVVDRDRHSLPRGVQYDHKATRRKGQARTDWYGSASASSRLAPIGACSLPMWSCTCKRVLASPRRLSEAGDVPASLPGKSATHRTDLPGGHSDC